MAELPVIVSLRSKINRLIDDNRRLRGECDKLTVQRDKLQQENRELKTRVAQQDRRTAVLEMSKALTDGQDRKKARARVNRLMREIDRCIALMNR